MILFSKSVPASNVFYRPKDQNGSPALPIHYTRVTWDQYFNILRLSISILILKHEKGTQKFILEPRTGVWRSWKISMRPLVTNICLAVISMSNCYRYFWCLTIKNVTGLSSQICSTHNLPSYLVFKSSCLTPPPHLHIWGLDISPVRHSQTFILWQSQII